MATLAVEGYRDLLRGLRVADAETRKSVRAVLRHAGEAVQTDARNRAARHPHAQKTAAGYKIRLRQSGVSVEQSLRKTTGVHPEWGAWQMRHALIPAAADNATEVEQRMEAALNVVAEHFNSGGLHA